MQKQKIVSSEAVISWLVLYIVSYFIYNCLNTENDHFQYPTTRVSSTDDVMEDIYDGQVFARLMNGDGFLSASLNVGLILSTDGTCTCFQVIIR